MKKYLLILMLISVILISGCSQESSDITGKATAVQTEKKAEDIPTVENIRKKEPQNIKPSLKPNLKINNYDQIYNILEELNSLYDEEKESLNKMYEGYSGELRSKCDANLDILYTHGDFDQASKLINLCHEKALKLLDSWKEEADNLLDLRSSIAKDISDKGFNTDIDVALYYEEKSKDFSKEAEKGRDRLTDRYESLLATVSISESEPSRTQTITQELDTSPEIKGMLGCESGHWIQLVGGNGEIIQLEDGSFWEVDSIDTFKTSIWLPLSEVTVCEGKMINLGDDEVIGVRRLSTGSSIGYDVIEASANDEIFIINGEVFEAKTSCFGFYEGDRVEFVSGSRFGACSSATILNLRNGKLCKVWCE